MHGVGTRSAAVVVLSLLVAGFVPAVAGAVPVVVTSLHDGVVAQFALGAGGALTPLCDPASTCPSDGGTSSPEAVAFSPDGRYVYVGNYGSKSISVFSVGASGALTPVACDPASNCATGTNPQGVAVDPSGTHLYVTNAGSKNVSVFSIGAGGTLTPLCDPATNCPATGTSPDGLAIDPTGTHLYVANDPPDDNVSVFSIGAGGALTPDCDPATNCPATGGGPSEPVIQPSGAYLYVPNELSDNVSIFSIGAGGALTAECDPSTNCPTGGTDLFGVAMDPSGGHLYVANAGSPTDVWEFSIGSGGALSALCDPATNCPATASSAFAAAVDPSGRYLYVPNDGANSVSVYSIGAGGALTPVACSPASNCRTGSGPGNFGIAIGPDRGPTAAFSANLAPAGSGSAFDASGSTSPDYPIASYRWAYGDGQTQTTSSPTVTHVYAKPGTYTVTLDVVDQAGCSQVFISTGQTASCDGSAKAQRTETVIVPPAKMTNLSVSPHKFSLAGRKVAGRCVKQTSKNKTHKACKLKIKLKVSYTLSSPATVTFTLKLKTSGRKVNGVCVKPTRENRTDERCTRFLHVPGAITMAGIQGANTSTFNGKIGGKKLGPGTYELIATPAGGGAPQTVTFQLAG
jgi:DNA-binding beta-propeller fold protein YncE